MAGGILPDQGLHPCPLHWQVDSSPLSHQGSPEHIFLIVSHTTIARVRPDAVSWAWSTGMGEAHEGWDEWAEYLGHL